jgi:hypothetical protein
MREKPETLPAMQADETRDCASQLRFRRREKVSK